MRRDSGANRVAQYWHELRGAQCSRPGGSARLAGNSSSVATRRSGVDAEQINALTPALRRHLVRSGVALQDVDDLVHETVTRLLEIRERLDAPTLERYARRVSLNLLASRGRAEAIEVRVRPRLIDASVAEDASEPLIRAESAAAVQTALAALPGAVRDQLPADDDSPHRPVTAADASRRNRARARFRLEYLLALRRQRVPTACYAILLAISARDTRRQISLGTEEHLRGCSRCRDLARPLARRQRRLFGLVLPFAAALGAATRLIRRHPWPSAATATVVAAATATALVLPAGRPSPAPAPQALTGGGSMSAPQIAAYDHSPLTEGTVLFESDSAVISPAARTVVDRAATRIRLQHVTQVRVVGHTDSTGSLQTNQNLAMQRAKVVAAMLGQLMPRIHVEVGEQADLRPLVSGNTTSDQQLNRRTTIEAVRS